MNNNLTWFGRNALASLVIVSITEANIDGNNLNYAHLAVSDFTIIANLIVGLILIGIIYKGRQNSFTLAIKWIWVMLSIIGLILKFRYFSELNIRSQNLIGYSLLIISYSVASLLDIIAIYFLVYKRDDDNNQNLPIVNTEVKWLTNFPLSSAIAGMIIGKFIYPREGVESELQYIVGSGILFAVLGYIFKKMIEQFIDIEPDKTSQSECPECLELIKIGAKKCKHCGSKLN